MFLHLFKEALKPCSSLPHPHESLPLSQGFDPGILRKPPRSSLSQQLLRPQDSLAPEDSESRNKQDTQFELKKEGEDKDDEVEEEEGGGVSEGQTIPVEEILTIDVKPGWKKGTKITFLEKGKEQPNIIPLDLVFIIDKKPHSIFICDGNDLIVTIPVPLAEAVTGTMVIITTLDGRTLNISVNNVIHPNYEEFVQAEGMPLQKDPSKKGNLRIKFDVKFPRG